MDRSEERIFWVQECRRVHSRDTQPTDRRGGRVKPAPGGAPPAAAAGLTRREAATDTIRETRECRKDAAASRRLHGIEYQVRSRDISGSVVLLRPASNRSRRMDLLWRCPLCGVRSDCTGLLTYVPVGHHITKSVQSACRNAISPASVRHGFCILPVLISQRANACAFICKSTSA